MPEKHQFKSTRTSAACLACRLKKQKCSGRKPRCDQCQINEVSCDWPRQQKRGPPKQYTQLLETRLSDTENVLLNLLSLVPDEQLQASFQQGTQLERFDPAGHEGAPDDIENNTYKQRTQTGPSYWDSFPMTSAEHVRRWWNDRRSSASETQRKDYPKRSTGNQATGASDHESEVSATPDESGGRPDISISANRRISRFDREAVHQDSLERRSRPNVTAQVTLPTNTHSPVGERQDSAISGEGVPHFNQDRNVERDVSLSDQFKRDYLW